MKRVWTPEQIADLEAVPSETVYGWFMSMLPASIAPQMDFLLMKGVSPEEFFKVPSVGELPEPVKIASIKSLYWRRDKLIAEAGLN